MNKTLTAIALLASFAAHADSLICTSQKQCEVMWANTQRAVDHMATMRIRLLTDTRIETYAPNQIGMIGAVATKTPTADGYEITLQAECYRYTRDCSIGDELAKNAMQRIDILTQIEMGHMK